MSGEEKSGIGWVCPTCKRGVAPTEKTCDHGSQYVFVGAPYPVPMLLAQPLYRSERPWWENQWTISGGGTLHRYRPTQLMNATAINWTARLLSTDTGLQLPITNVFNRAGEEIDDPGEAYSVVAGYGSTWIATTLEGLSDAVTR